jgi:hypothetical protein
MYRGTDYTYLDCKVVEHPRFGLPKDDYIEITQKIKVEFECERPKTDLTKSQRCATHMRTHLSIVGSVDGADCVLSVSFSSQEEQEKVFKKLIEAFGG